MRTITRKIVGAFIFSEDGKILLGKNHAGGSYDGYWTIPGGGVEKDEEDIDALMREVMEEVGIDITNSRIDLIGTARGVSPKKLRDGDMVTVEMEFCDYKVTLDTASANVVIKGGDGFGEARWFDRGELDTLSIAPPAKKTLLHLVA